MTDPLEALYWRDEILQMLYWFRGEGLGELVTAHELAGFAQVEEGSIQDHLDRLAEEGYVTRQEGTPTRYRLTEQGVNEGGRRFAEEFAGLTGQAHGECSDPRCICHYLGPEACGSEADPQAPRGH